LTSDGSTKNAPDSNPVTGEIAFSHYTGSGYELAVVNADGTGMRTVTQPEAGDVQAPDWSPDGETIAYLSRSYADQYFGTTVNLVQTDGSAPRVLATVPGAQWVSWSPQADTLLVSTVIGNQTGDDGEVLSLAVESGTLQSLSTGATAATWASDGESVYFLAKDGALDVTWRVARGHVENESLLADGLVSESRTEATFVVAIATSNCGS
jgi:Tol biopolymer transport system component